MERSPLKFIELRGEPIKIQYAQGLRDSARNEAHAASFIRERRIVLDNALKRNPAEHARILTHELLHFVWVRLGNRRRLLWEELLRRQWRADIRGEAGWSAEWRRNELTSKDVESRSRRWREYCCEAFCDTGALLCTGDTTETTLPKRARLPRTRWFESNLHAVAHI